MSRVSRYGTLPARSSLRPRWRGPAMTLPIASRSSDPAATTAAPTVGGPGTPIPGCGPGTAAAADAPTADPPGRPEVLATARAQRWDPAEVVRTLLTEGVGGRDRCALATRTARAAFPTGKTCDAWDEHLSCIPVPTQNALRTLEWIDRIEKLVVCGPAGTGKTFLLEALDQQAVAAGKHVAWFTLEHLGILVRRHRADDSVAKASAWILRTDLVIVDDIGLLPVGPDVAEGLYRLLDAGCEKGAIAVSSTLAVSSNLNPSGFDQPMRKAMATAAAAVDRVLHHVHVRQTSGTASECPKPSPARGETPDLIARSQAPGGRHWACLVATGGRPTGRLWAVPRGHRQRGCWTYVP